MHVAAVLILAATLMALFGSEAAPAAVVRTAGCADAFEWRIRMEMHRTAETRSDDPEMARAFDNAQRAADLVGQATGCAAALWFDVVDDPLAWDTSGSSEVELSRLTQRENRPGPWQEVDLTILSRPAKDDDRFLGTTDYSNILMAVEEPYLTLTTHELLHVFERFYAMVPWPNRDPGEDAVHEQGLWEGYPFDYDGVLAFHRDLLAGVVAGNLGMARTAWAVPETLRARKARLRADSPAARGGRWQLRIAGSFSRRGVLRVRVSAPRLAVGQPARISVSTSSRRRSPDRQFASGTVMIRRPTTWRLRGIPSHVRRVRVVVRVKPFRADGASWRGIRVRRTFSRES